MLHASRGIFLMDVLKLNLCHDHILSSLDASIDVLASFRTRKNFSVCKNNIENFSRTAINFYGILSLSSRLAEV